jgi:hypothetical protein
MGSSSERNCDARKRVPGSANVEYNPSAINSLLTVGDAVTAPGYSPVDGLSPNCTICLSETPVAGKEA